jgi:nitrite reductase/ring-hydroxylating ferredoxin subunit
MSAMSDLRRAVEALLVALDAYKALPLDQGMRHKRADTGREVVFRTEHVRALLTANPPAREEDMSGPDGPIADTSDGYKQDYDEDNHGVDPDDPCPRCGTVHALRDECPHLAPPVAVIHGSVDEYIKSPAKRWRCETCGKIVSDDELCEPNEDYQEFHHLDIRGMPCGPVEEEEA